MTSLLLTEIKGCPRDTEEAKRPKAAVKAAPLVVRPLPKRLAASALSPSGGRNINRVILVLKFPGHLSTSQRLKVSYPFKYIFYVRARADFYL